MENVAKTKGKNAVNYDTVMRETLSSFAVRSGAEGTRVTLLLHSCCAPCSSACLEILKEYCDVTVFYYNPNIDEREEYEKRKSEQIRFLKETGWAEFIDCDYDNEAFEKIASGKKIAPKAAQGVTNVTNCGFLKRRNRRKKARSVILQVRFR